MRGYFIIHQHVNWFHRSRRFFKSNFAKMHFMFLLDLKSSVIVHFSYLKSSTG